MKKKLEELNLLDDFLFGTLISHPVYGERFAKILIKTILNRDVKILKIVPQMNYYGQDTDRHGARLDVYIEEAGGVVQGDVRLGNIYDIEPDQNSDRDSRNALPRGVRFYRSTIDARSLQAGADYNHLKNVVIIMLLPYDPFGYDRMVYTVRNKCLEEPLREVQSMVDKVKYDKEVSISYMKSYERDRMIRNEGVATGRLEGEYTRLIKTLKDFLSDLGTIPEKIMTQIDSETDFTILERWMKLAAKSDSIEAFIEKM